MNTEQDSKVLTRDEVLKNNLLSMDEPNIQRNVGDRWDKFVLEKSTVAIFKSMDEYAQQEAISFFKWYAIKSIGFLTYLAKVKPEVTSNEIEEKLKEFEGQSFEQLYKLYSQSKNKQPV